MAGINLKFKKIDKILRDNGFQCDRHSGSHAIYKRNEGETITIPVPNCNGLILQRLFRQYNIKY